ncbi:hypothetical protein [Jiulongibacter sediminis]|jgi:hypothetical protein|uniref:hypothetical protein n=1 Tax=Jiulongibacter sediminis TaxID=1605367 RepID=UPI0026EF64E1|nr:hypothetical protein [Jiulongibacter sediminis]
MYRITRYLISIGKLAAVLLLVLQTTPLLAQLTTQKRVNFEMNTSENDEFNVISFQERGLVVLNTKTNNFGRDLDINFLKFNTELENQWRNQYKPGFLFRLLRYFETENYLFCLFREDDSRNINVLRLDINTGDYVVTETKLLTNMDIDLFKVIKSKILIGGRYNDRPVVEMINLFAQTGKVLPEIHSNNIKLNNIEVNANEELVYVMLKNTRNCKMLLKVYDYDGKLIGKETLGEKNKLPLNGKLIKIPNGDFVLAGNYADNCSDYSVGFYTHSLSRNSETQFYDFVDLKNFLSYMPEKRQNRVKSRISRKNQKGKDFKLRQRLLIHEPIKGENGMTMLAEVFYPEYKNYNTGLLPIGRNYRWGSSSYYAFNNFRYTHALILHFDANGKLEWDNSIALNDMQSRTLDYKVQLSNVGEDKYIVAYPDEEIIKTAIVNGSSKTLADLPVDLENKNERILETYQSELASWYDHTFVAYGIQSIRQDATYSKDIFYLTKLSYE